MTRRNDVSEACEAQMPLTRFGLEMDLEQLNPLKCGAN